MSNKQVLLIYLLIIEYQYFIGWISIEIVKVIVRLEVYFWFIVLHCCFNAIVQFYDMFYDSIKAEYVFKPNREI